MGKSTLEKSVLPVLEIPNLVNPLTLAVMEVVELMIVRLVFLTVIQPISASPTVSKMGKKTLLKLVILLTSPNKDEEVRDALIFVYLSRMKK
jgi:hypothetical protein